MECQKEPIAIEHMGLAFLGQEYNARKYRLLGKNFFFWFHKYNPISSIHRKLFRRLYEDNLDYGNPFLVNGKFYNLLSKKGLISNNNSHITKYRLAQGYRLIAYQNSFFNKAVPSAPSQTITNTTSSEDTIFYFQNNLKNNIRSIKIEKIVEGFSQKSNKYTSNTNNNTNNMIYYILFALFVYYIFFRRK
jgi:hypothetical protein